MINFDVIGGIELTLGASIVAGVFVALFGRDVVTRTWLSAILGAWFVLVVTLGATGALHYAHGTGSPGLGAAVVVPIALMWVSLMWVPRLRAALDQAPLWPIVASHVMRVAGVSFLTLQSAGRLPAPFAPAAGWGDIIAGVAAVPVAWMIYRQARGSRGAVLAWNVFGALDLINAVTLGVLSSPGPLRHIHTTADAGIMSLLPWLLIPGFIVPLLFVGHLAVFYRLLKEFRLRPSGDQSTGGGGGGSHLHTLALR